MLGRLEPVTGDAWLGPASSVGELDQARTLLTADQPLSRSFPSVTGWTVSESRTLLAKFGLGANEVDRPLSSLSPGQRTRCWPLLSARGVNTLVLDEPTNHLDLPAIERARAGAWHLRRHAAPRHPRSPPARSGGADAVVDVADGQVGADEWPTVRLLRVASGPRADARRLARTESAYAAGRSEPLLSHRPPRRTGPIHGSGAPIDVTRRAEIRSDLVTSAGPAPH
jgi:hypothetical protein